MTRAEYVELIVDDIEDYRDDIREYLTDSPEKSIFDFIIELAESWEWNDLNNN